MCVEITLHLVDESLESGEICCVRGRYNVGAVVREVHVARRKVSVVRGLERIRESDGRCLVSRGCRCHHCRNGGVVSVSVDSVQVVVGLNLIDERDVRREISAVRGTHSDASHGGRAIVGPRSALSPAEVKERCDRIELALIVSSDEPERDIVSGFAYLHGSPQSYAATLKRMPQALGRSTTS
jgi:hypothetical protein